MSKQLATTEILWVSFFGAFLLGMLMRQTNFCTMGAISDVVNMGHWGRIRMWLLAVVLWVGVCGVREGVRVGVVRLQQLQRVQVQRRMPPLPRASKSLRPPPPASTANRVTGSPTAS